MYGHDIHLVECLGAVWALSHSVGDTILDTAVAEEVATSFQGSVLEMRSTNGAKCKSLKTQLVILIINIS